jgi:hypothetical protein
MIHRIEIVAFALVGGAWEFAVIVAPVMLDTGTGIGDVHMMGA